MKNVLLTAGLFAFSTSVSAAIINVPQTPVIEAPINNATDVSTLPLLQATTPSDNLAESQWIVYPKSDVRLIGGFLSEENYNVANYAEEGKQLIELGYEIQLNNAVADGIWVYPNAIVELVNVSEPNTVIARIDMEFDTTAVSADENDFIVLHTLKDGDDVLETKVEWHLKDNGFSPEWDMKLQAIISKQHGFLAAKFEENALDSGIWVSGNTDSDIGFSGMGTENNYTSVANFASTWTGAGHAKFSMACVFTAISTDCDQLSALSTQDVAAIERPEFQLFVGDAAQYQVTGLLNPVTDYEVQVRYFTEKDGNYAASNWSDVASFSTSMQTSYSFTSLNNNSTLRAGEVEEFRFWVRNSGQDAGQNVSVQFLLPFNALDYVNGNVADFYQATLEDEVCSMSIKDGNTYFLCNVDTFSTSETLTLEVNAFIPTTVDDVLNVYYLACDTSCEGKTMNSEPRNVTGNSADTESSESSSGGGSLFWMLLGLPLVLRRKF